MNEDLFFLRDVINKHFMEKVKRENQWSERKTKEKKRAQLKSQGNKNETK